MKFITHLTLFLSLFPYSASAAPRFEFRDGEKVVFLGDSFIEREQYAGWIELAATTQFPDRNVTFANLGWGRKALPVPSKSRVAAWHAAAPAVQALWNYHPFTGRLSSASDADGILTAHLYHPDGSHQHAAGEI